MPEWHGVPVDLIVLYSGAAVALFVVVAMKTWWN